MFLDPELRRKRMAKLGEEELKSGGTEDEKKLRRIRRRKRKRRGRRRWGTPNALPQTDGWIEREM